MTKQELINTLEWFKNQAINLRDNGEDQNMDWGSLIDDINDTFKHVEIEDNYDDEGPEYDSAGFTEDDRIVNGQYRVVSNEDADADAKSSNEYQQWWEQNKERILAEDQLNHEMQFKSKFIKHGDY